MRKYNLNIGDIITISHIEGGQPKSELPDPDQKFKVIGFLENGDPILKANGESSKAN